MICYLSVLVLVSASERQAPLIRGETRSLQANL